MVFTIVYFVCCWIYSTGFPSHGLNYFKEDSTPMYTSGISFWIISAVRGFLLFGLLGSFVLFCLVLRDRKWVREGVTKGTEKVLWLQPVLSFSKNRFPATIKCLEPPFIDPGENLCWETKDIYSTKRQCLLPWKRDFHGGKKKMLRSKRQVAMCCMCVSQDGFYGQRR